SINQCKITKNLSQNVVHSDSDLILHNSSVLIDKEPFFRTKKPSFLGSIISRTDRKSFYRSLLSMKKQNIQKLR
ncbi:hypothetical protein DMB20_09915, partial [Enterococcus faecium]